MLTREFWFAIHIANELDRQMDRRWLKGHLLEDRPVRRTIRNCRRLFVYLHGTANEKNQQTLNVGVTDNDWM